MAKLLYIPIPLEVIHGYHELEYDQFTFLITIIADSICQNDHTYYSTSISALIDDEEMLNGSDLTKLELYYLEIADNIYNQLEPIIKPLLPVINIKQGYVSDMRLIGNRRICLELEC